MQTAAALVPAQSDPRWPLVWAHLELEEGTRFTCLKNDNGGASKFGLTLTFLQNEAKIDASLFAELGVGRGGVITVADVEALNADQAQAIYFHCIWLGGGLNLLRKPFDAAMMDQIVNDGPGNAIILLQKAINVVWPSVATPATNQPVPLTGSLGPLTRGRCEILAGVVSTSAALLTALRAAAADRYRAIVAHNPSQAEFLDGWLKRAAALGSV